MSNLYLNELFNEDELKNNNKSILNDLIVFHKYLIEVRNIQFADEMIKNLETKSIKYNKAFMEKYEGFEEFKEENSN